MSDTTERSDLQAALDELAATANYIADERNELLAAAKLGLNALGMHGPCEGNTCDECTDAYRALHNAIARAEGQS